MRFLRVMSERFDQIVIENCLEVVELPWCSTVGVRMTVNDGLELTLVRC